MTDDIHLDPQSDDEDEEVTQPLQMMEPLHRRLLTKERGKIPAHQREPISETLEREAERITPEIQDAPRTSRSASRSRTGYREVDPLFAYLFLVSLAIGLSTFEPTIRYLLLWTLMGATGVMGYLFGTVERAPETGIEDLVWGISFGLLSSFPFLLVFSSSLATVSSRMFDIDQAPSKLMDSWVFMAVAFIVPSVETLFFRGTLQSIRGILLTTILATVWSSIVFFPNMELAGREAIALILLLVFSLLNFVYSYVKLRNGLVGAWLCQIVSYTLLWFFPRLIASI